MLVKNRLILALDLPDLESAKKIVGEVNDLVDGIKIGYPLLLNHGSRVTGELDVKDVIWDLKLADIPHINGMIAREAFDSGASGIIAQGFVGRDSLASIAEEAADHGGDLYVVVEMSHLGSADFLNPRSLELLKLAQEVGATGIVAPGNRPERIELYRSLAKDIVILCPGIGAQGGDAASAIKAGADYVIVGRAITKSKEPRKAAEEILRGTLDVRRQEGK
jgi:orotidine-5'-phosphate decarboxylase